MFYVGISSETVIMGGLLLFSILILLTCISISIRGKNLIQKGIKGEAEIRDLEELSWSNGINPTIKFQLNITLPDRPPYQIEHQESIRHIYLDSVRIGAKIPVYVDPNDSKFILLDFPINKVND